MRARLLLLALISLAVTPVRAAVVNFVQTSVNDVDASTIAAVSSDVWLESGISYETLFAPDSYLGFRFTHWTNSSYTGQEYRDYWGRARRIHSFVLLEDTTTTAHYLPEDRDTDGDSIPDWYELFQYNALTNDAASDTDADGYTLLQEYTNGTEPHYVDPHFHDLAGMGSSGSYNHADSSVLEVNLAGYPYYTIRSKPAGTVDQTAAVPDGTLVTTPNFTQSDFGYWMLDGVRQEDFWGRALRYLEFTVDGANREAVAYFFAGDTDADGIPDAYEQLHYGTLDNDAASDTDTDGYTLLQEYTNGTEPHYVDPRFSDLTGMGSTGSYSYADSGLVVVNLQPFERLSKMLIGGVLTNFFSPDPNVVTGIQAGTWSSTAATDWDGDGDQDLFIAHEDGLRVFHNIGTAHNPNFEEIASGFAGLNAYIAAIARPGLCGGDWNGDGLGDLVIGGNTGTLRLIASGGAFTSNASGLDLTIPGTTSTRSALGDMNDDGRADLLVLLDDGTVSLFLNNGTSVPFSGSGSANFLGTPAPDGTSIAVGDINQDGLPDVLLADSDGRIWEFINNSSGGFSLQSKVWGGSYPGFASGLTLAAFDIEGDGDLDIIGGLANGGIIALRDPNVGRPTGLIARPGANSVQLDWDPNWQSRIRGYYVYRTTAEAGPFAKLLPDIVPLPSYLDAPVDPSILHYYYVTGVSQFFLPGNSTPRISESLPSDLAMTQTGKVILSVRPARGNPGQTIKINLSIENAVGVSGENMEVRVAYDPAKLTPLTQVNPSKDTVLSTGLSRNLTFTDNGASATGELIISGTGGTLEPGSGKLFTLQFEVGASVPKKTTLGVSITDATMFDLFGNALAVEIIPLDEPETGDAYTEGDLDGDGLVTNADKDFLKDLTKPKSRPPTAEELMAGDLNGDGKLDVKDFVLLVQMLNGP